MAPDAAMDCLHRCWRGGSDRIAAGLVASQHCDHSLSLENAGAAAEGAAACYADAISAFISIIDHSCNRAQAIGGTQRLLEAGTDQVMRIVTVAGSLATATAGTLQPVLPNG